MASLGGCSATDKDRRRRRLTLAPATSKALRASLTSADGITGEIVGEHRRAEGRAALSRTVALAVESTIRPKPVHGSADFIPFRFWSQPGDDFTDEAAGEDTEDREDTEDEEDSPSTTEFIQAAKTVGFSVDQLARAERALNACMAQSPEGVTLARSIVQTLVKKKTSGRP